MQTQLDIQGKIEQYGLLRRALRAIEASSPDSSAFGLADSFQQVRGWLLELRAARDSAASSGSTQISSAHFVMLEDVGRMLDELQRSIFEQVSLIPLSQLRATLPAVKRKHPEALAALLDVCLVVHATGSAWSNLVDYLITLLVCEEQDGRRFVARDPTRVTPLMQALCSGFDRNKTDVTSALAEMFRNACGEVERGVPAGPIIDQMRSAKHQAMETLLVPELLRAITAYNVAVSNQRTELIETQRALEEAEFEAFEESLGTRTTAPAGEPAPPLAPYAGDALDSPALRAFVAALGRQLRSEDPGPGPEAELAAELDLSKLSAYELSALRDPVPCHMTTVVATAVGVGLILRNFGDLGDRLVRAGISAEQLQNEWVAELESRMAAEAAALLAGDGDGYEEARRVAEVRTRQLRSSDAEVNVWRLERDDKQDEPVAVARKTPAAPPPAVEQEPKARKKTRTGRWPLVAASIACVVALGVGVNLVFTGDRDAKVAFFSDDQLEEISIYVESGYRNGKGAGPAFVGTLRPQWGALSPVEREEFGHAIEKKLLAQGISEFMFFDTQRELMLHHSNGRLEIR